MKKIQEKLIGGYLLEKNDRLELSIDSKGMPHLKINNLQVVSVPPECTLLIERHPASGAIRVTAVVGSTPL